MLAEVRDALELFNEKASRVIDVLLADVDFSGPGALVIWDDEKGWDSVHVGPDTKTLEAAILNLRFFCQDNEPTSFRNMSLLYASQDALDRERFEYVRAKLNRLLTRPTQICILEGGPNMTHREVFELFLYGHYAHAGSAPTKREAFMALRGTPFFAVLQTDFAAVLGWWAWALQEVRKINIRILEQASG